MSAMPVRVLIAGGGVAALELVLALRAPERPRYAVTVITPRPEFVAVPEVVAEPFAGAVAHRVPWAQLAAGLEFDLVLDRVVQVEPERSVLLDGGTRLPFDELVIAVGAERVQVPGASTLTPSDADELHWVIDELEREQIESVVFAAPRDAGFTLPIYELALMAAGRSVAASGRRGRVAVVTWEPEPLASFGADVSAAVREELQAAGVVLRTGHEIEAIEPGVVRLRPGGELPASRVVTLPPLRGVPIGGLPLTEQGFVVVDETFAVAGCDRVHAIGDATDFPIKHGGLATQQADYVADRISHAGGLSAGPFRPRLRAVLWTGGAPLYLAAPADGGAAVTRDRPWTSQQKVVSRYAGAFLDDVRRDGLPAAVQRFTDGSTPANGA